MVVSHLTRSRWRKVDGGETEQMKSCPVSVGGGTNLDLSESAVAAVDGCKESAGPPGAAAAATRMPPLKLLCNREISILDFRVTTLSPQEVTFGN